MPAEKAQVPDSPISLPLYVGGLAVTLCGIQTVSTAMGVFEVTAAATLLSALGFGFSLLCRRFKVQPRLIEMVTLALAAYIVYGVVAQTFDYTWFLQGADRPELRVAAVLMWSAVLRSWTVVSDDMVMFSCVLAAAMIGLTGTEDVNTATLVYFCLFVLSMLFLLIHHNALLHRQKATEEERARPARRLLPAQAMLALVCGLAALGLGLVVIIPAQAALGGLSLTQAIRSLVGAGTGVESAGGLVTERFSDDPTLEVGQGSLWPTSQNVVMHVTPGDGQPHYWRGRTYDVYTGSGWHSTQGRPMPLPVVGEGAGSGTVYAVRADRIPGEGQGRNSRLRAPMTAVFTVRGETEQFYYADEPRSLLFDPDAGTAPRLSPDGRIDLQDAAVRAQYSVASLAPPDATLPDVAARLRQDGAQYPSDVRQLYLGPPPDNANGITTYADTLLYERAVKDALRALPPQRRTPYDKAMAIRDWIAARCTYSLTVDPTPPDEDHVRAFLFDSRRGYCDLFASAMVVLCRTAGIPARLATGFAPGEPDGAGGFNLRALDKHAWAEVYFPGDRWQIFDATIGTRTDGSVPTPSPRTNWAVSLWRALTQSGPVPLALASGIALILGYVLKTEVYDRWRAGRRARAPGAVKTVRLGADARAHLAQQYALLTRVIGRLGLPRRPAETPDEYAARAVPFLTAQEARWGVALGPHVVQEVTAQFVRARYGVGETLLDGQADTLARFAAAAARARRARFWRRLWGRHASAS